MVITALEEGTEAALLEKNVEASTPSNLLSRPAGRR